SYGESSFFSTDGAPQEIQKIRREGFRRLASLFRHRFANTIATTDALEATLPDLAFVNHQRVPFQYHAYVQRHPKVSSVVQESDAPRLRDMDGNWSYDIGGSYGVNLFGPDLHKGCIEKGVKRAGELGPVLGPYHPVIADNVARLKRISGFD